MVIKYLHNNYKPIVIVYFIWFYKKNIINDSFVFWRNVAQLKKIPEASFSSFCIRSLVTLAHGVTVLGYSFQSQFYYLQWPTLFWFRNYFKIVTCYSFLNLFSLLYNTLWIKINRVIIKEYTTERQTRCATRFISEYASRFVRRESMEELFVRTENWILDRIWQNFNREIRFFFLFNGNCLS